MAGVEGGEAVGRVGEVRCVGGQGSKEGGGE